MSLENITLPPYLVEQLYKNALIDTQNKGLAFLGGNKKNILVVVNSSTDVYLADDALNFLSGILKACNLTLEDIALVNFAKLAINDPAELIEQFEPSKIIFFGQEPVTMGFPLQFPYYQIQEFNGKKLLYAPGLETLAADKPQKLLLWEALKKLLEIK